MIIFYIKAHWLVWILMAFTHALVFLASCNGHLQNINSLDYVSLPNVDTFHCKIWLKHHSLITLILLGMAVVIRKSLSYQRQIQVFQNSSFLLWTLSFATNTLYYFLCIYAAEMNTLCCFPWSGSLASFIFLKYICQIPKSEWPYIIS